MCSDDKTAKLAICLRTHMIFHVYSHIRQLFLTLGNKVQAIRIPFATYTLQTITIKAANCGSLYYYV